MLYNTSGKNSLKIEVIISKISNKIYFYIYVKNVFKCNK